MGVVLLFLFLLTLGQIYILYNLSKQRKRYLQIKKTETINISSLTENGFYEIKGRAKSLGHNNLYSPLSKKKCVYFHFIVEEERRRSKSTTMTVVIDDKSKNNFLIQDETGEAIIQPENADIYLENDKYTTSGTFNSASPEIENVLKSYGISSKGLIFNKSMTYYEKYIEEDDNLYIIGDMELDKENKPTFQTISNQLFISDKNENSLLSHYK